MGTFVFAHIDIDGVKIVIDVRMKGGFVNMISNKILISLGPPVLRGTETSYFRERPFGVDVATESAVVKWCCSHMRKLGFGKSIVLAYRVFTDKDLRSVLSHGPYATRNKKYGHYSRNDVLQCFHLSMANSLFSLRNSNVKHPA